MKSLLTFTALIEGLVGVTLLIIPSFVVSMLLGTSVKDESAIFACRLAGVALLTIAIACWLSRNEVNSFVIVKSMLAYNIFATLLLLYSVLFERISGPGLWPAVFLHIGLLAWCIFLLRRPARNVV